MKSPVTVATAVLVALVALGAGACGGGSEVAAPATAALSPAPTALETLTSPARPPADVAPALVLSNGARGLSCSTTSPDLGWFDVTWKTRRSIDDVHFRLVGAHGVRAVGNPVSVPPRNFGGRIDYGGVVRWTDRSRLGTANPVIWAARQDADFLSTLPGETGMLLFHLRFDPAVVAAHGTASLGDVVAHYTTADGKHATARVASGQRYAFDARAC